MSEKSHSRSSNDEPLACPECARRYGPGERFCDDCGMPLVHAGGPEVEDARDERHARQRKIRPEYTRGELVRVAGGRNQPEAELIQGLLLEEGVPSMLRRTAGFDVPDFLAAGPRDVMVPESGAAAAREALRLSDLAPAEGDEQPFGSLALRIVAGLLVIGFAGLLLAWVLFQTVT
jgi:hypothetical protein